MSDAKVLEIALKVADKVRFIVDEQIKLMVGTATSKSDAKKYYKSSRQVFKAVVAAAAQRMMDDGANRQLVHDSLGLASENSWELYLARHPDIAAKLEPKMPKPMASQLKLMKGGLETETPAQTAAALAEDEEPLMKDGEGFGAPNDCDCSCHDLQVPAGCGNCECGSAAHELNGLSHGEPDECAECQSTDPMSWKEVSKDGNDGHYMWICDTCGFAHTPIEEAPEEEHEDSLDLCYSCGTKDGEHTSECSSVITEKNGDEVL